MNEPFVSVKTVTYNHSQFIRECIEGVLMQKTNFPFEYIIGEDCSTDNTLEIVNEYARKYPDVIRVITSAQNVGARENGRRTEVACRGKYVAFCEGDDYWTDPYKLQKQVDFLEANPDYGLVHSSFSAQIGKVLEKDFWKNKKIPRGNVLEQLIMNNNIATAAVCMRNQLLHGFQISDLLEEKNWSMGDYPLWLEVAAHSKIGYLPGDMMTYRVHANSVTHRLDWNGQYSFFRDRYDIKNYFARKYQQLHLIPELDERYHKELLKYSIFLKQRKLREQCIRFFRETRWRYLSVWYLFSRYSFLDPLFEGVYYLKKKILLKEAI